VGKKAPIDKFCRGSFGAVCERERRWSHGDNSERSLSLVLRWRRSSSVELALTRTVAAFESGRRRWRLNRWHAALRTRCRRRRTRVKIFFFFHFGTGLGRNKVRSPEQSRDQVCWIISFIFLSPMALSSPTFQNNRDTTSPGATTAVQTKIQQMVFSDRTVENV
jgi:hypothetical protein